MDIKQIIQNVVEPHLCRSGAKEKPVLCEQAPDFPRILFDRPAVCSRDPERFKRYALAVQHAKDVMIRNDQQRRRIGKRFVVGKPLRIRMPVRADYRQHPNFGIRPPGDGALRRIGREQPVLVKTQLMIHWASLF